MLQQDEADDYVIATGEQHSVREFVSLAAQELGMTIRWEGDGIAEKGYEITSGNLLVAVDPRYFRPTEVETLLGDSSKAKQQLGWTPKISFMELVKEMVATDMRDAERDTLIEKEGFKTFNYHE